MGATQHKAQRSRIQAAGGLASLCGQPVFWEQLGFQLITPASLTCQSFQPVSLPINAIYTGITQAYLQAICLDQLPYRHALPITCDLEGCHVCGSSMKTILTHDTLLCHRLGSRHSAPGVAGKAVLTCLWGFFAWRLLLALDLAGGWRVPAMPPTTTMLDSPSSDICSLNSTSLCPGSPAMSWVFFIRGLFNRCLHGPRLSNCCRPCQARLKGQEFCGLKASHTWKGVPYTAAFALWAPAAPSHRAPLGTAPYPGPPLARPWRPGRWPQVVLPPLAP